MRLKSYFAPSTQAALDKARSELGPDAMLISSRQTERELQSLGSYEVVFGTEGAQEERGSLSSADSHVMPSVEADNSQAVLRELTALRRQILGVEDSVTRSRIDRATEHMSPHIAGMFNRLKLAGFSPELSNELVSKVSERIKPYTSASQRIVGRQRDLFAQDLLQAVLEEEIASRFEVSPGICSSGESSAVMFVGPSGAGKTTSIIKASLISGLKQKRPVHLLTLDTMRVGGLEQLQRYGRISCIDCRPLYDFSDLENAVTQLPKGLTLIDTPGMGKKDSEDLTRLATMSNRLSLETHLVLPAHLSLQAAQQIWERFAPLRPAKLLLTHLDELTNYNLPLEWAMRCGLPISFLADGQRVPEDFRPATKAEFMRGVPSVNRALTMAA